MYYSRWMSVCVCVGRPQHWDGPFFFSSGQLMGRLLPTVGEIENSVH